jgi:zinc transport system substrate-binding protein
MHRSMPPASPPHARFRRLATALLLSVLVAACGMSANPTGPPIVVVSVLPQRTFVERIAGARVRTVALLPPGASPASHEPTLADLRALDRAILLVKVGHPDFPFEQAWLAPLLAEHPDLPVVGWGGADLVDDDPHVWLSPARVRELGRSIETALAGLLPEHALEFAANRSAFEAELDRVDAELRRVLEPHKGRRFLVLHPAWGHLAAEYGLVQWAIEREGKEPDAATLAHLIAEARAAHVTTLFSQPQFDSAPAELLAQEIGARALPLDPLAADWAPNLTLAARAIGAAAVP